MIGKTIRIYLPEGNPNGVRIAEIMNWTGHAILVPRADLAEVVKRPEFSRTGVYILIGPDPEDISRDASYVGEGDEVRVRVLSHHRNEEMDFWEFAVALTSKDDNLTKSHVRYLESRLIEIGKESGRYRLTNGTAPPRPPLPEPEVADMEVFLEHIRIVLPILGVNLLKPRGRPQVAVRDPDGIPELPLELEYKGATATARVVGGEIVVEKGSLVHRMPTGVQMSYLGYRERLLEEGKLAPHDQQFYVFTEDVPFASVSAAAVVISGRNRNGRTAWRVRGTDRKYKEWQEDQLASPSFMNEGQT